MELVERIWRWFAALPAVVGDTGLALLLTAFALYESLPQKPDSSLPMWVSFSPTDVAVISATALPVALRRRFPVLVLVVIGLATFVGQRELLSDAPLVITFEPWGLLVALYTVAAYCPRRTSLAALGLVVVLQGYLYFYNLYSYNSESAPNPAVVFYLLLWCAGPWLLGDWVKTRRAYTAELEQRAARLAQEREQRARLAVAEERVRIARELHDVLAHYVSVMGIQAAAARRVLDRCREEAVAALASIETTSRQAMTDLHHMVGLLRREDETPAKGDGLAPQPGLEQLPALITAMREAGLAVELQIEGDPQSLPAAVQLSVYRIAQEALTNTLKHAGPAQARVTIRHHDGGVELEVLDDGQGPPANPPVGGNGLVGMRERVVLHGGQLEAGPRPEGGFRVHAVLDGRGS